MTRAVADLRRLTPPRGDAEQVRRYLSGVQVNAATIRQLATAIERKQPTRIRSLRQRLEAGTVSTRMVAAGYGFRVCGSD